MTLKQTFIDNVTDEEIVDGEPVYEITIRELTTGDITVSHISDETRSDLITGNDDLAAIFLHD